MTHVVVYAQRKIDLDAPSIVIGDHETQINCPYFEGRFATKKEVLDNTMAQKIDDLQKQVNDLKDVVDVITAYCEFSQEANNNKK